MESWLDWADVLLSHRCSTNGSRWNPGHISRLWGWLSHAVVASWHYVRKRWRRTIQHHSIRACPFHHCDEHPMSPAPKRQWLRFSLRTLLLAVAISAVCLAWTTCQLHWMRARSAVLQSGVVGLNFDSYQHELPKPPWSLRLFGERPINAGSISLPSSTLDDELLAMRTFSRTQYRTPPGRSISAPADDLKTLPSPQAPGVPSSRRPIICVWRRNTSGRCISPSFSLKPCHV